MAMFMGIFIDSSHNTDGGTVIDGGVFYGDGSLTSQVSVSMQHGEYDDFVIYHKNRRV